jgi:hypothetical protein
MESASWHRYIDMAGDPRLPQIMPLILVNYHPHVSSGGPPPLQFYGKCLLALVRVFDGGPPPSRELVHYR